MLCVAVRTECSKDRTENVGGRIFPSTARATRFVSRLLDGTRAMLVLYLPAFENKKYTASDRKHGNGSYGEIPTKKEPIKSLGFPSRLPCQYNKPFYVYTFSDLYFLAAYLVELTILP